MPNSAAFFSEKNEIINICKRISEGGPTLSIAELAKDIGILHEFLKPRTSILCYDKQYEKQLIDKFQKEYLASLHCHHYLPIHHYPNQKLKANYRL